MSLVTNKNKTFGFLLIVKKRAFKINHKSLSV